MKAQHVTVGAAVVCAAVLASLGVRAETRRQERVSVTGCPYVGTTANCLMIKGPNGTVYNITSVLPRPRDSARMIRVRGTITDKVSACGEGIVLERIRWTHTRLRCPN